MGYSEQVLRRARQRLEQAKTERDLENAAHRETAYARYPRLAEIDRELKHTMAQLMATALRHGEDPAEAVARIRDRNLALQQEREWILEAGEFEEAIWTIRRSAPNAAAAAISALRCAPACGSCAARSKKRS